MNSLPPVAVPARRSRRELTTDGLEDLGHRLNAPAAPSAGPGKQLALSPGTSSEYLYRASRSRLNVSAPGRR